jgi:hypothetical protein
LKHTCISFFELSIILMTAVVHLAPDCLKELDAWSAIAERIQHVRLQLILKQNYLTKVDYSQQ